MLHPDNFRKPYDLDLQALRCSVLAIFQKQERINKSIPWPNINIGSFKNAGT